MAKMFGMVAAPLAAENAPCLLSRFPATYHLCAAVVSLSEKQHLQFAQIEARVIRYILHIREFMMACFSPFSVLPVPDLAHKPTHMSSFKARTEKT